MVGLLDIAPVTKTVAGVTVFGITAKGIASLLERFPEVRMMMTNKEVDPGRLLQLMPDAVAAIIAAGIGFPDNAEQEEAASRLPVETQVDFLQVIFQVTMPSGVGPFVERLRAMGLIAGVAVPGKDQVTKSPKLSKP